MTSKWLQAPTFVKSVGWWFTFLGGVTTLAAAYAVNIVLATPHPRTTWGLVYGTVAASLLSLALVYGVRRRLPRHGPAPAFHWLQLHVYGGALFLLAVAMHTTWRFPTGVLAWLMWGVSVWVVVSGVIGVALQKWIPRSLSSGLSTEVHYNRIPELVDETRRRVEALVGRCAPSIASVYKSTLAAAMAEPQARLIYFVDITGGIQTRLRALDHLKELVPGADLVQLEELRALVKTKLEMDAQLTLQRALRWWLFGHVPFTIVLGLLVAVHILAVLYY